MGTNMKRWVSVGLGLFLLPVLVDAQRRPGNRNPLAQLEDVLKQAGAPLSEEQQEVLARIMEERRQSVRKRVRAMRRSGSSGGRIDRGRVRQEMRQTGEEFQNRIRGVLTAEQRQAWEDFQAERMGRRGGFEALKSLLGNAGTPLTADQETQVRAVYDELRQQRRDLLQDNDGQGDPERLEKLETEQLRRVVQLLNPEQRNVLLESRRKSQG